MESAPTAGGVLVIEDDRDARELLLERVRRLGLRARGASTGEEGLASALDDRPDLILLDILLPGIDGWEVFRRLHADERVADVPVVVISIVDADERAGQVAGYLVKPFRAAEVEAVVHSVLEDPTIGEADR